MELVWGKRGWGACALLVWPGCDCADCGPRRWSKEEPVRVVLPEEVPPMYSM